MTEWQYAQLRVTYDTGSLGGKWTIDWQGPDATNHEVVEAYGDVVAELNRAGAERWELADVAVLAGDSRHSSHERDWSLTRYTFVRPYDLAAQERDRARREIRARSQAT